MSDVTLGYIKTYIKGLDEQINGGIPIGHVVLICGYAGSMKSSFAYNVAYHYVKDGNGRALYLSLEQSRDSIIKQMNKMGMDITELGERMSILDVGWMRKELKASNEMNINWMESIKTQLKNYKEFTSYDLLIIDSLDALYSMASLDNTRSALFFFFESLRELDTTTLLITEMDPDRKSFGKYGIESFLADGIIHLDFERVGRSLGRFISIVKMRAVKHSTDYYSLIVDQDGFKVVTR
ncbi:MAG: AAA family ATPase [Candidatus Thermoplasmatota archaeon]|nr:AAA family ATPase [Candidatus Thermoplasmatota archaeon]MCL5963135.1 AAA family ATPase [Candidatus Thermoplasmatota archaeon]